ncbi:hypothetical protein F7R20_10845 [Pseudomonas brassicacearum subsp. brassicacearum]|nr:hypothetical protein F7R20_10845 [Pseudomonas brassicacearum subsp. brassicacearum]QEO80880.1 hypothetical protein ELZ14_26260 [Pseudomonas brassicacearum]
MTRCKSGTASSPYRRNGYTHHPKPFLSHSRDQQQPKKSSALRNHTTHILIQIAKILNTPRIRR